MAFAQKTMSFRRDVCSALGTPMRLRARTKCAFALVIFILSLSVRSLHAVDLAPLMYTADQPGWGMTMDYDSRAVSVVRGHGIFIPDNLDASDTSLLSRPPGYSLFLGPIYVLCGRNFFAVELIQNLLDSVSPILIFLIAGALLSWRVAVVSGLLAAMSQNLANISNLILPDSLCVLPLLTAAYLLFRAERRPRGYGLAALAGLMLGLSIWLRANAVMMGPFLIVALALISVRRQGWRCAGIMALVSFLAIAPITIRNYLIYGEFVPLTDHLGVVLWEGLGEAGGDQFGAVATDAEIGPQEAILYGEPRYQQDWSTPDGIRRDHDRIRRSLRIVVRHPFWFSGVVLKRMERMLRYSRYGPLLLAGTEKPDNERQLASRPPGWQDESSGSTALLLGESIFWLRPAVRVIERITRETTVLFMLIGVLLTFVVSRRRALLILIVPLYYLLLQATMHTEARYTAAMQYFLFIFAATVWVLFGVAVWNGVKSLVSGPGHSRRTS